MSTLMARGWIGFVDHVRNEARGILFFCSPITNVYKTPIISMRISIVHREPASVETDRFTIIRDWLNPVILLRIGSLGMI